MERHLWAGPVSNSSFIPRSKHSIWQVLVHNTCLLNRYLELRNKAVSPKQWLFSYEDIGVENSPLVSYWSSIFSPLVGISFQGPDLALPVNTLREEGGHLFKKKKEFKKENLNQEYGSEMRRENCSEFLLQLFFLWFMWGREGRELWTRIRKRNQEPGNRKESDVFSPIT